MEECFFIIAYGDWVMITMGAGDGYFMIGYFVAQIINNCRNNNQDVFNT